LVHADLKLNIELSMEIEGLVASNIFSGNL